MTRAACLFAGLLICAALAAAAFYLVLSGRIDYLRAPIPDSDYAPPELRIESARFSEIAGWREGRQAGALEAFQRSCARILAAPDEARANPVEALGPGFEGATLGGVAADWKPACAAAPAADAPDAVARAFFETHFTPVRILAARKPKPDAVRARRETVSQTGLFTGYFEPSYAASPEPQGRFTAPLLARPADLVMVDLGEFREALAGERIAGHVQDGRLRPYPDHAAINQGALAERAGVLAYLDPNDLFFLQIQGSGRLVFEDGSVLRAGYDGQNGRPYTAVGRALIESGAIARENISMQTIRAWLDAAPQDEARALREVNQSYVFFRESAVVDPALGPLGSEGAPLTAMRSLAVDRRYHAMGLPVWLAFDDADAQFTGLYVAQDTGGAIRGPVRGDIFIGAGDEAGEIAGVLKAQGEMIALLPRPIVEKLGAEKRQAPR